MRRKQAIQLVVWGLCGSTACYSGLGPTADGTDGANASGATDGGTGADTGSSDGGGEAAREIDAPTLRRLTAAEFSHAVVDLLGPVTIGTLPADFRVEGFVNIGAAKLAVAPAGVAEYENVLLLATQEAFADPERVAQILACVPSGLGDDACIREALARFGRRAWRRPLTDDELDRFVAIVGDVGAETGDVVTGMRHATWALLQSPYFLYRVELGAPSGVDPNRLAFDSWEMASRLSFTLWSSVPDEVLLDAAADDELVDPENIADQAERMLADPRARAGVEVFAAELYGMWALGEKDKDAELHPEWTDSLKASMRAELLARVTDVVFDAPGDYFSLYDSDKVFVDNELAAIYGLPTAEPDGLRAATLPAGDARRGLIGSALVLAMNSLPARTSPTERGKFIADTLLCRTAPPPPPGADTMLPEPDGPMTMRERLEPHRSSPACMGCHALTDPLGLALEHFDTVGRYRETDNGLTLDVTGELDGVPFADAAELATLLRDSPDAPACLVNRLFAYSAGRVPLSTDAPLLERVQSDLADAGNRFDRLLLALVTHEDFRFANPTGTVIAPDDGEMP
ncbi:MAG: DUF1592 domain-containing protein [Deltaproteobacteria bacterium]|nr:DUF1592 domain-containing protein [Deltaproteobacteria bacterium]